MNGYEEVEGLDASTYAGKAAKACRLKVRGVFSDELLTFKLIDFVNFMLLNNKFISKGIAITDSNKEECYIKIIETGEEELINDLEKFITLKDDMKRLERDRDEFYSVIKQLQDLTDKNAEDAVNTVIEAYLRK